jgi:hypothetical protein
LNASDTTWAWQEVARREGFELPEEFNKKLGGLWGDELQPARDRAGVAGAAMGAHRNDATGSLRTVTLETASQVRQVQCRWRRRILTVGALPHAKSPVHRPSKTLNALRHFPK